MISRFPPTLNEEWSRTTPKRKEDAEKSGIHDNKGEWFNCSVLLSIMRLLVTHLPFTQTNVENVDPSRQVLSSTSTGGAGVEQEKAKDFHQLFWSSFTNHDSNHNSATKMREDGDQSYFTNDMKRQGTCGVVSTDVTVAATRLIVACTSKEHITKMNAESWHSQSTNIALPWHLSTDIVNVGRNAWKLREGERTNETRRQRRWES